MSEHEVIYIDSDSDDEVVLISEGSQAPSRSVSRSQSVMSFMGSQATEPPSSQPIEPDSDVEYLEDDDDEYEAPADLLIGSSEAQECMLFIEPLDDSDLELDLSKSRRETTNSRPSSAAGVSQWFFTDATVLICV
jgi:hypothetical protein